MTIFSKFGSRFLVFVTTCSLVTGCASINARLASEEERLLAALMKSKSPDQVLDAIEAIADNEQDFWTPAGRRAWLRLRTIAACAVGDYDTKVLMLARLKIWRRATAEEVIDIEVICGDLRCDRCWHQRRKALSPEVANREILFEASHEEASEVDESTSAAESKAEPEPAIDSEADPEPSAAVCTDNSSLTEVQPCTDIAADVPQ